MIDMKKFMEENREQKKTLFFLVGIICALWYVTDNSFIASVGAIGGFVMSGMFSGDKKEEEAEKEKEKIKNDPTTPVKE